MKIDVFKHITFLVIFLCFSCSLHTNQTLSQQPGQLPEAAPAGTDNSNENISDEKIYSYGIPYDYVEEFNYLGNNDGLYEIRSGLKDINGESLLISHNADNEENIKVDAEESPADEEKGQNLLDSALDFINTSQEYWSEGNLDKAIATLDEAYTLVVKVDIYVNPDLVQQKEDLRFMISRRILEIYASRYTATNGNHNEIPLTLNEHVEKEIKRFQGRERRFFMESYKRSGRYMPKILESLREAGLPDDLAWLPLIESGFKVRALSRARALGLWQFIPSTGYKFGLKRDTWIDERLDPEKATAAAIAYMKELHKIFGDWTTVLAAYNCGEGRVLKKIRNQRINYLDNFWDLYQQLPRETARYVPRFLATLHILKDPVKYGFTFEEPDTPISYETVTIEKPVQLKAVAKTISVPLKELTDLNPELRHKATPATQYLLKIPAERKEEFLAHVHEIPKWAPPKSAYVYHRVRKGETLSTISLRYRTSVSKIVRANNIRRKHFIRAGQKLKIPLKGSSIGRAYASSNAKLLPGGKYRVKKGDSLWLIAKKFKTNTKSIQQINDLRHTRLKVGQILKIKK
jgi:membrane-bound lytic murein transglycosylase D